MAKDIVTWAVLVLNHIRAGKTVVKAGLDRGDITLHSLQLRHNVDCAGIALSIVRASAKVTHWSINRKAV
jgi:hypothetical protein